MRLKPTLLNIGMILAVISLASLSHAESPVQSNHNFFSLVELKSAEQMPLAPLEYTLASDDISLAYRAYLPRQAHAILIFYHGAGAHSGLSYNHIGTGLRDNFNIAVYMPDIRGHGGSEGDRGDAPKVEQVWADINNMVTVARKKYPHNPIFVGGHSSGAGLVLNYSSWEQRAKIDGYVFLAPYFGFRSETQYDEGEAASVKFSNVKTSRFIINAISGGLLLGHSKAVEFNFPDTVLKSNPEIVPFNTVNMSNAVTPHSPDTQLAALQQFGLWIGKQDEAFDPLKVIKYAQQYSKPKARKDIELIDQENHFSIILRAPAVIGPWLEKAIK